MSKPIKNLIAASYRQKFADVEGAVMIDIRGVASNDNNKLRAGLAAKDIHVTVVQNNLAKLALADTDLKGLSDLFTGPSALVYGGTSVVEVARELMTTVRPSPPFSSKAP
jgi:large subunit ribosomal protein L10